MLDMFDQLVEQLSLFVIVNILHLEITNNYYRCN